MINKHIQGLAELENEYKTSLSEGLSAREARVRLENENKKNKNRGYSLFVPKKKNGAYKLFSFVCSPFAILLLLMAILTAIFGRWLLGISVFAIALAATVFGGIICLRASRGLEGMREYGAPMARVKRGGSVFHTDGRNLVRGDVILLRKGDLLTCDVRLIRSEGLIVDEFVLDGKKLTLRRTEKKYDAEYSNDSEVDYPDAANMLFAGSAVIEGTAIALVVSVGDEVYLSQYVPEGALGGKDIEPDGVKKLRPVWYKASFLCAAGLVFLTLLGFLTLHGKETFICFFTMLMSAIFLVSVELLSGGSEYILSSYIHRLFRGRSSKKRRDNTASIRTISALDALTDVNELVLFGRVGFCSGVYKVAGAFYDGRMHEGLACEEDRDRKLLELVHAYIKAQRDSGIENTLHADGVTEALQLHLHKVGFDVSGASLALRNVYFATDVGIGEGFACAETDRMIYRTAILDDIKHLSFCKFVRKSSEIAPITEQDAKQIGDFYINAEKNGSRCLLCVSEIDGKTIFEGIIVLELPMDSELERVSAELSRFGVHTTVMISEESEQLKRMISNPSLAPLFGGKIALASEFAKSGKKIIDGIGEYCAYLGFTESEYENLLAQMKNMGAKIAVYGVDNKYNSAMAEADVSISCDTVKYSSEKYRDSVYERIPPEGRDTNVRASQQTRLLSKVTVRRFHENGGGLSSILKAIKMSRGAYVSVAYSMLLFVYFMIGLLGFSAMSIITGTIYLNPIQTVALSTVFAFLSITVFADAEQKTAALAVKRDYSQYPYELIRGKKWHIIARVILNVFSAVVIKVLDAIGIFGEKATYTLPVFICLLFSLFAEVFFINNVFTKKGEGRGYCWLKVVIAYALLLGVCSITTQMGYADEFFANGFGSLEYFIIPGYVVMYFIMTLILHLFDKKRKK